MKKAGFVGELLGRSDYAIIGEIVEPKSRVLDLGCGEGELLEWLAANKGVEARGVELAGAKVQEGNRARRLGVPVRYGPGAGGLPGPGIRLRDSQPDPAGDTAAAEGATRDAACGAAGDCGVSEFRPLEGPHVDDVQRTRAADGRCFPTSGTNRRTSTF